MKRTLLLATTLSSLVLAGCSSGDPSAPTGDGSNVDAKYTAGPFNVEAGEELVMCTYVKGTNDNDEDIVRFSTYVGQGAIRFYLPLDVALPNDFFAQSVVVTKGLKERDQVRARLEQAIAERFPGVVARIYPL